MTDPANDIIASGLKFSVDLPKSNLFRLVATGKLVNITSKITHTGWNIPVLIPIPTMEWLAVIYRDNLIEVLPVLVAASMTSIMIDCLPNFVLTQAMWWSKPHDEMRGDDAATTLFVRDKGDDALNMIWGCSRDVLDLCVVLPLIHGQSIHQRHPLKPV